jgi:hypothetical protein
MSRRPTPFEGTWVEALLEAPAPILILVAGLATAGAAAPDEPPASVADVGAKVEVTGGLLTLRGNGAPLSAVVRAIGEKAGFETTVKGELDRPVTLSFSRVPLERGLRELLDGVATAMLYAPAQSENETRRLIEVRLYGWARTPPPRPREPLAPDVIARLFGADPDGRIEAIQELARSANVHAIDPLARVLAQDADPAVRGQAAGALGQIGDPVVVPALKPALEDDEQVVQIRAIRALARVDAEDAADLLGDVLLNHAARRSRLTAAWALGRQASPLARAYLQAAANDPDEAVREAAGRSLSLLDSSAVEDAAQDDEGAPARVPQNRAVNQ